MQNYSFKLRSLLQVYIERKYKLKKGSVFVGIYKKKIFAQFVYGKYVYRTIPMGVNETVEAVGEAIRSLNDSTKKMQKK